MRANMSAGSLQWTWWWHRRSNSAPKCLVLAASLTAKMSRRILRVKVYGWGSAQDVVRRSKLVLVPRVNCALWGAVRIVSRPARPPPGGGGGTLVRWKACVDEDCRGHDGYSGFIHAARLISWLSVKLMFIRSVHLLVIAVFPNDSDLESK